jgi:hypothetical protein
MNLLNFSFSSLMAGFVYGVIGIALFRKGKKEANFALYFIGVALMVYPYVVSGALLQWGTGAALCALAYYLNRY